ncbi:MAG: hypothetical protein HN576_11545 [Bacteriovoracaceae bacterium]|jgi:hypothetical protein|nr:hypothetical protein [Bacteriovoracaceae bacterium]
MKTTFTTLLVLLFSIWNSATAFENNCLGDPINLEQEVNQSVKDLVAVVEANKVRQDLLKAKIQYGILAIGIGVADIFLTTKDGKIVDLNVHAKVGLLGINSVINKKVTISQLKAGQPLKFQMQGGNRAVLIIEPEADFNEKGGWARLKIWNGSSYTIERIAITQGNNNPRSKYKSFHNNISNSNEIKGLKIQMHGSSISKMYVKSFTLEK